MKALTLNMLLTSVGRRVELVRAFKKAYAELELEGRIWATDIDALAPALQEVDGADVVPRFYEQAYPQALSRICERERIDLVFPLIDPDVLVLAESKELIETSGARVVVIPRDSVAIISDKWATFGFFRDHGVPTPRTQLPQDLPAGESYPLFVKPRRGSAGKDTFRVSKRDELEMFMRLVPDPVIQEYVDGPEITTDVLCDLQGEVLAVVSRERIEVRSGEVAKGKTVYDQMIQQHCVRLARALNVIGPITVQSMMTENGPMFTEINARFAGGVPLAIAAGADLPRWFLARAAGLEHDIPPLGTYETDLYLTRYDDSYILTKDEVERGVSFQRSSPPEE